MLLTSTVSDLNLITDPSMFVYFVLVYIRRLVDSILEAVLTVSPNRQYLGILYPTIPATHGPALSSKEAYIQQCSRGLQRKNIILCYYKGFTKQKNANGNSNCISTCTFMCPGHAGPKMPGVSMRHCYLEVAKCDCPTNLKTLGLH